MKDLALVNESGANLWPGYDTLKQHIGEGRAHGSILMGLKLGGQMSYGRRVLRKQLWR